MKPHLGSWISALADGQLNAVDRQDALAHIAACPACARELADARRTHRALVQCDDVTPDPALTARLVALQAEIPTSDGDPLRCRSRFTSKPIRLRPHSDVALNTGDFSVERTPRLARLLTISAGGVGVLVLGLFFLGQSPPVAPDISSSEAITLLAGSGTDERAAGRDVLTALTTRTASPQQRTNVAITWITEHGWVAPAGLPDGLDVEAVRLVGERDEILEIHLSGSQGHVVLRERRGRLANLGTSDHGEVHVLGDEPAHIVWQAGDIVIDVVAETPDAVLTELVAAFPSHGYDAGVLPRIVRGWNTATGALSSP